MKTTPPGVIGRPMYAHGMDLPARRASGRTGDDAKASELSFAEPKRLPVHQLQLQPVEFSNPPPLILPRVMEIKRWIEWLKRKGNPSTNGSRTVH